MAYPCSYCHMTGKHADDCSRCRPEPPIVVPTGQDKWLPSVLPRPAGQSQLGRTGIRRTGGR